jgi:hypothetical protein
MDDRCARDGHCALEAGLLRALLRGEQGAPAHKLAACTGVTDAVSQQNYIPILPIQVWTKRPKIAILGRYELMFDLRLGPE